MEKQGCTAIVLAAGQGRRMGTKVQKQYLELGGKPVLYYSLQAFEESDVIDDVILVVGKGQESYCRTEIIEKYGLKKVNAIIPGGAERYESVYSALKYMKEQMEATGGETSEFVFIHDGARPFVENEMILRAYHAVRKYSAAVVGMPVKDTIKVVDQDNYAKATPERSTLWLVQTPQVFLTELVQKAYFALMEQPEIRVTDDAMVMEQMLQHPVKLVEGSYENIKITTPEDICVAEAFLRKKNKKGVDNGMHAVVSS